ncbi:uncharacterized protein LOC124410049 isoform X2 [Diprion similis]|uniref:uncharacterized protein LOC124410049 isoform X2 n=1 Tax=Diprion similis TaxID=362088 RepID=UPI001EF7AA5D|nr:uncharacterized protein LOC124410049 isoform X2 [Diprion similis]
MRASVFLIAAMSLILCQEGVFPLDLNANYLLGSLRNATVNAGNYISNAVAVPRNALINAKAATTNYIDSTASKGVEVKFRAVMETIRVKMPNGLPALDIPPLEPLKIEHETYNLSHKDVGNISTTVDNATISGLSTFVLNRVQISVIGGVSLAVNLSVPTIRGNGHYEVHGSVGRLFPLNSTGPFEFEAQDTRFYIHVVLGYSGSMYVKSLDTDFSVRSVKARFYHLFKDPEADETMSEIISELVPQILEIVKPEVKPRLEEVIAQRINASVARLNMGNILGILTGTVDLQTLAHLTTSGPQILQPLGR